MIDDPLPPVPVDPPVPPGSGRTQIICEFCGCTLTPHGHAMRLSDQAKKWRDHDDDVTKLKAKIEELETVTRTQARELADLKTPSRKSVFD